MWYLIYPHNLKCYNLKWINKRSFSDNYLRKTRQTMISKNYIAHHSPMYATYISYMYVPYVTLGWDILTKLGWPIPHCSLMTGSLEFKNCCRFSWKWYACAYPTKPHLWNDISNFTFNSRSVIFHEHRTQNVMFYWS